MPGYTNSETGEEVQPNFRDVFNFKGIFVDKTNQVSLALRRCTPLDYSRFFSNAHGKTADDLKY